MPLGESSVAKRGQMEADLKEKVYKVITGVAGQPINAGNETFPLNQLGIDSLSTLSLLMSLQEEFGCEFDFDKIEFSSINSASGLAAYIEKVCLK
ncbi:MAG: hypothetical protein A2049_10460 [Elusimicrobia bacterium GWA2_62_23]|nr:MAG: hypothetical protein A2049_10460 [Elusimicrobia bacterium GWA2_62_23]